MHQPALKLVGKLISLGNDIKMIELKIFANFCLTSFSWEQNNFEGKMESLKNLGDREVTNANVTSDAGVHQQQDEFNVFFEFVVPGSDIFNEKITIDSVHLFKTIFSRIKISNTGDPRYPRSFYPRIRLFTHWNIGKKAKFLVKMCLFICEFRIRGPKKWDVSTANNEVHLYLLLNGNAIH